MKRFGLGIILILAFVGIADSTYLAQHEAVGSPLLCNIADLTGCNTVVSSEYSHIFGIPLANLGLAFYALLFVLVACALVLTHVWMSRALQILAVLGILSSVYSVYLQVSVIHALCIYCLISAALTLFVFIIVVLIEPVPILARLRAIPREP